MFDVSLIFLFLQSSIFAVIAFVLGLGLLIKGADILVREASRLAKVFSISPLLVGLVLVSFGTSLPELVVSWIISLQERPASLILANVLGSNIANTLLILGTAACIGDIHLRQNEFIKHLAIGTLSLALLAVVFFVTTPMLIDRGEGAGLLLIMLLYLTYLFRHAQKNKDVEGLVPIPPSSASSIEQKSSHPPNTDTTTNAKTGNKTPSATTQTPSLPRIILLLSFAIILISVGGEFVSRYALVVAVEVFHANEVFAGIILLSLGTSLPELITSIMAFRRAENDLLIGNILGSNIFNILFILSTSTVIRPFEMITHDYSKEFITYGLSIIALFLFSRRGKRNTLVRRNGLFLLALYGLYLYDFLNSNVSGG